MKGESPIYLSTSTKLPSPETTNIMDFSCIFPEKFYAYAIIYMCV